MYSLVQIGWLAVIPLITCAALPSSRSLASRTDDDSTIDDFDGVSLLKNLQQGYKVLKAAQTNGGLTSIRAYRDPQSSTQPLNNIEHLSILEETFTVPVARRTGISPYETWSARSEWSGYRSIPAQDPTIWHGEGLFGLDDIKYPMDMALASVILQQPKGEFKYLEIKTQLGAALAWRDPIYFFWFEDITICVSAVNGRYVNFDTASQRLIGSNGTTVEYVTG